jgi:hypothetical protein
MTVLFHISLYDASEGWENNKDVRKRKKRYMDYELGEMLRDDDNKLENEDNKTTCFWKGQILP